MNSFQKAILPPDATDLASRAKLASASSSLMYSNTSERPTYRVLVVVVGERERERERESELTLSHKGVSALVKYSSMEHVSTSTLSTSPYYTNKPS